MAATLKDVAEHAGVSISTVSRVVRGLPIVTEEVKERVHEAIAEVGYRPDAGARSIRTGVSHTVGFVVPDISNWFYSMVFRGAQDVLYEVGYDLVLATSNGDLDRESHAVGALLSRRVDGFILSLVDEEAPYLPRMIAGLPTVLVDRECKGIFADSILADHAAGVDQAVRHLAELGHTRMALLSGTKTLYTTRERRAAFLNAARSLGLPEDDLFDVVGDRSVDTGERATRDLMQSSRRRPTAIIAGSNQLLHGSLLALHEMGFDCPSDVSLVACEDSPISQLHSPAISVVARDVEMMGEVAGALLLDRFAQSKGEAAKLKRPSVPSRIQRIVPTKFIPRASTGPPSN